MNRENLRLLIEHVESLPSEGLDMSDYVNDCGTALCLAGHAALLDGCALRAEEGYDIFYFERDGEGVSAFLVARDWLGLSHTVASSLFFAKGWPFPRSMSLHKVTKEQALEALRTLEAGR